jgi:endonuclease YncB( thermonuclease family)
MSPARATVALIALLAAAPASAADMASAPFPTPATLVSVYDGDTLTVDAHPWPGVTIRARIRLLSIDAPELRGRCAREREMAVRARDRLAELAGPPGTRLELRGLKPDKYAGRYNAEVVRTGQAPAFRNLGARLLAEGLARPYDGGRRQPWCA